MTMLHLIEKDRHMIKTFNSGGSGPDSRMCCDLCGYFDCVCGFCQRGHPRSDGLEKIKQGGGDE